MWASVVLSPKHDIYVYSSRRRKLLFNKQKSSIKDHIMHCRKCRSTNASTPKYSFKIIVDVITAGVVTWGGCSKWFIPGLPLKKGPVLPTFSTS